MSEAESHLPDRLTYSFAKANRILATEQNGNPVLLGTAETTLAAFREARRVIGEMISIQRVSAGELEAAMNRFYANSDLASSVVDALDSPSQLDALADGLPRTADLLDGEDDAPVIRLINGVLQEAIRQRASDIHIEPFEERLCIRFRVDGVLLEVLSLSARLSPILVSRVKVMSQLDIAQKRVPQDGRFSLNLGSRPVDVRVSTLPAQHGERVVLRILEKDSTRLTLSELGMDKALLADFAKALRQPNGIILVTGPTGSGKTTTLYAGLTRINDGSCNILTVEDPIEYALDGVGQTQVNNQVGMSFASGLRAILRQDPDVVMVGEIRDPETAEIAVQAALTGHLVLSTVHTNSSVAAIARLRDMGVEPFLLASTVTAIVAQRLVRRLCPACKQSYEPSRQEMQELGIPATDSSSFYKAKGCDQCLDTGYKGRLGLYELILMDDHLRAMIHEGGQESQMAEYAFKSRKTLLSNGIEQIKAGQTSAAEVLRVCRAEKPDAE